MAGSDGNLQLALRITADVKQATESLQQTSARIDQVGASARAANTGSSSFTRQLGAQVTATQKASTATKSLSDTLVLFNKIDPLANKLGRFDDLSAELNRLHKAGAIGAADFANLGGVLAAQRKRIEAAAAGMSHLSLNSSFARREVGRLGADLANGNFGRFDQTLLTLANGTGVLSSLMNPLGVAVLGVVAAVGSAVIIYERAAERTNAFNQALIQTNGFAGKSAAELDAMSQHAAGATQTSGDLAKALTAVVASGKFTGAQIKLLGQGAADFATVTGGSIQEVVRDFEKLQDSPVEASRTLNDQYHYLTASVYDQIAALEKQGDHVDAVKLAQQSFVSFLASSRDQVDSTLTGFAALWADIRKEADAASNAIEAAINATGGFSDYDKLLNRYMHFSDLIAEDQRRAASGDADAKARLPGEQAQLDEVQGRLVAARAVQQHTAALDQEHTAQTSVNTAYIDASANIDRMSLSLDKNAAKQAELNKLHQDFAAIAAKNPNDPRLTNGTLETLESDIEKRYAAQKGRGGLGIDRAQLSADVQAFQAAWSAAEQTFSNAERSLEAGRRADTIDDQAYFRAKQDDIDNLLAAQLKALDAERASLPQHAANAAERIRVDQQVKDIDLKAEQAKQEAAAKTEALNDAQAQNARRRAEEYSQLRQQYYEAVGDTGAAQLLRVQSEFDKVMQQMLAAGNVDGQILAEKLFNVQAAQARLQQIQQRADTAFGQLDLVSQRASADQQAGLISELQARQRVIDANLQYAKALQNDLAAAKALAEQTKNPEDILHYEQLAERVRELQLVTSALGEQVQSTFTNSFSQFLQNISTGAENLRDAFRDLFRSIAQGLARIAADSLSQQLFSKLFHPGGVGAAASSAASATQNATALTTAATSAAPILASGVTTGGATAATQMSTAIVTAGATAGQEMAAAIAAASAGGGGGGGLGGLLGFFGSAAGEAGVDGSLDTAASVAFTAATGGLVHGPGTETSDSILARLSRGEYVLNAAAVRHYGASAIAAMNDRRFPRFAEGGFVGMPRLSLSPGGGGHAGTPQAMRVVVVMDPETIPNAMAGAAGERVVMAHAKKNIPTLRQYVR